LVTAQRALSSGRVGHARHPEAASRDRYRLHDLATSEPVVWRPEAGRGTPPPQRRSVTCLWSFGQNPGRDRGDPGLREMTRSTLGAPDQALSEETKIALYRHLLRGAPSGHELPALRRWRIKLRAQRSAGDATAIDSRGRSWRLDDALFVAFDRLEHDLAEPARREMDATEPRSGTVCIFCGAHSSPGQSYCYGCGRDAKAKIRTPVMEASWIRAHAHRRGTRR
jgi:hypothetical protein